THAQRIAQIAERLERDAVGRPALELIRAVGHQKMAALLVERLERGPMLARLLSADQGCQGIGAVSFALERLDEAGEPLLPGIGPDEVEPIDAATPRLGL